MEEKSFSQISFTSAPQGKRIVGEDGSEAVNDMYHENQMLSTEIANMRTRLKALQETVEVLTAKNTALLAEKATSGWITCGCWMDSCDGDVYIFYSTVKIISRSKFCTMRNFTFICLSYYFSFCQVSQVVF